MAAVVNLFVTFVKTAFDSSEYTGDELSTWESLIVVTAVPHVLFASG